MPFGKRLIIVPIILLLIFGLVGLTVKESNGDAEVGSQKVYTSAESDPVVYTFTSDQTEKLQESKARVTVVFDEKEAELAAFYEAMAAQEAEEARLAEQRLLAAATTTTTSPPVTTPAPAPQYSGGGNGDPYDMASWDRLAQCESGGNWHINTGNGYYGGLQFSLSSWRAVGGTGYPHEHSREEQIRRGQMLWESGGWGHWPGCTRKFGWR